MLECEEGDEGVVVVVVDRKGGLKRERERNNEWKGKRERYEG